MKHSLIPYSQPDGCSNLAHDPRFMMGHCLPRGVQLALAICALYKDAKYIIGYCQESVERAKAAMLEENQLIRIGTSPIMPAQILMDLWPKIHEHCQDVNFKLIPFENTTDNAREILKNLGQNIDVVPGFIDELLMAQRSCQGLVITNEPLCAAVSIYHPLAGKEKLSAEDLYGQNLMIARRGWCKNMDDLRDDLITHHPDIRLVDFDLYDVGIFNRCEQSRDVLVSIKSWSIVHPLMKVIPVEWDHHMPVGILYSPDPSEVVKRFIEATEKVLSLKASGA